MRALVDFWASQFWGWAFGKAGSSYTIVPGKHIGLDMARRGDVPALFAGTVVRAVRTTAMAWVVVLDTGLPGSRRFHSYCHLATDRLPRLGDRIGRGERVGRVALGARDRSSPEWGGTAWDGPHLHFVAGGHPESAYLMVRGHRALSAFTDPTVLILEALAAPSGGYTPFIPEEDDMPYTPDEIKQFVREAIVGLQGADGGRNVLDSVKQTRDDVGAVKRGVDDVGGKVWRNPLTNPVTGREMPAKEFLRYLPHHHRDIMLEVRALNVANLPKLSDSQLEAYAAAVDAERVKRSRATA